MIWWGWRDEIENERCVSLRIGDHYDNPVRNLFIANINILSQKRTKHNIQNGTHLDDVGAAAGVAVADHGAGVQPPLGDDVVVGLAEVASAAAELVAVRRVVDVVVIVVRVVPGALLALRVLALLAGHAEEAEEAVADVAASSALELLEVGLLGHHGGPEGLALLGVLLAPSTPEVFEINDA